MGQLTRWAGSQPEKAQLTDQEFWAQFNVRTRHGPGMVRGMPFTFPLSEGLVVRGTCRGACVVAHRQSGHVPFPTAHRTTDSSDPLFQLRAATLSLSLAPPTLPQPSHRALPLHCSASSPARARHGHDRVHRRHAAPEARRRRALPLLLLLCLVSQEAPPRRQVRARRLLAPLWMNGCPPDSRPVATAASGCRDDERPNPQVSMVES
jgi:hypothetical protein